MTANKTQDLRYVVGVLAVIFSSHSYHNFLLQFQNDNIQKMKHHADSFMPPEATCLHRHDVYYKTINDTNCCWIVSSARSRYMLRHSTKLLACKVSGYVYGRTARLSADSSCLHSDRCRLLCSVNQLLYPVVASDRTLHGVRKH